MRMRAREQAADGAVQLCPAIPISALLCDNRLHCPDIQNACCSSSNWRWRDAWPVNIRQAKNGCHDGWLRRSYHGLHYRNRLDIPVWCRTKWYNADSGQIYGWFSRHLWVLHVYWKRDQNRRTPRFVPCLGKGSPAAHHALHGPECLPDPARLSRNPAVMYHKQATRQKRHQGTFLCAVLYHDLMMLKEFLYFLYFSYQTPAVNKFLPFTSHLFSIS
ncbi:hypothetical protein CPC735_046650 [Coccidioides posadasii C735 delta SOWgp]|uniref:Uncharacterized protein n=1 Tax=Coccidioides posadasii (strain C735) TaxID=222929 RepID=C5PFG7_COCP7|nr:hypothetical protein CPC735_046650 [Coccidioides posadasii C735 delta SOWgp]EER23295.1 hypothetical protein CPC735_046650 [Coccidioides posadasii C735 delta SOWgp]|eukprot:XP_003065440.1 hypothetical protein CPC735_046650 [Coccidioides posadasii C735 delta SOWgp]